MATITTPTAERKMTDHERLQRERDLFAEDNARLSRKIQEQETAITNWRMRYYGRTAKLWPGEGDLYAVPGGRIHCRVLMNGWHDGQLMPEGVFLAIRETTDHRINVEMIQLCPASQSPEDAHGIYYTARLEDVRAFKVEAAQP